MVQPALCPLPELDRGRLDPIAAPERGQRALSPAENFCFSLANFCSSTAREEIAWLWFETQAPICARRRMK